MLPPGVGRVDHEAELAVVIGRRAHRVPRARAWDYVFGITAVNDVTARDMQNKEIQYTRAKSFDTFAPFGPCIATVATMHRRRRRLARRGMGQRRATPALDHRPADLPDRLPDRIHHLRDDARAGRHHLHRDASGRRTADDWRRRHGQNRGGRRAEQSGDGREPNAGSSDCRIAGGIQDRLTGCTRDCWRTLTSPPILI